MTVKIPVPMNPIGFFPLVKNQRKNRGANGLRGAMQACTRVWGLGDSTVGSYQAQRPHPKWW